MGERQVLNTGKRVRQASAPKGEKGKPPSPEGE